MDLLFWLVLALMAGGLLEEGPTQPAKPKPATKEPELEIKVGPATEIEPIPKPTAKVTPKPTAKTSPKAQAKAAKAVPVSWPQAKPTGLPAFPAGWEPDAPPPKAVTARAWQLLASLWKGGKPGQTQVEQTGGRWITYQGFVPSKGKRGVAAWRVKPGQGGKTVTV